MVEVREGEIMDFYGVKRKGKPVFDPAVEELRRKQWNRVKEGMTFKTSMTIPRKGKSWAQVKLIWGNMIANTIIQADDKGIDVGKLLIYLISEGIPKGQAITPDYIHQLMYIICPTFDEDGNTVTLSGMDTEQASSLFKRYQTIMAGMGINIEDPPALEKE